jgi:hypothetical protein
MKNNTNKIGRNQPCPCDSGRKFKNCCDKKGIDWRVDSEGEISRFVPVPKEVMDGLKNQMEEFKRIFGREMRDDEPIFFRQSYLDTPGEYNRRLVEAMNKANTRPELIYAYKKTGLIVSTENKKHIPVRDLEEWNDAIDEYFENKEEIDLTDSEGEFYQAITEDIEKARIVLSHILHSKSPFDATIISNPNLHGINTLRIMCIAKTIKSCNSISVLLKEHIGSDCFSLARGIFENYLNMKSCDTRPEEMGEIVEAKMGLADQSFRYFIRKNGEEDYSRVVEIKTGKIVHISPSNYSLSKSSTSKCDEKIYKYLYTRLSGYAHPDVTKFVELFGEEGIFNDDISVLNEGAFYSAYAVYLCVAAIYESQDFSNSVKMDLKQYLHETRIKLIGTIKAIQTNGTTTEIATTLITRLSEVDLNNQTCRPPV